METLLDMGRGIQPSTEVGKRNFGIYSGTVEILLPFARASLYAYIARDAHRLGDDSKAKEAWQKECQAWEETCNKAFAGPVYTPILNHRPMGGLYGNLEGRLQESFEKPPWEREELKT